MSHATDVESLLNENERRKAFNNAKFNPLTGEGSVGERFPFYIAGLTEETHYLPIAMKSDTTIIKFQEAGDIDEYLIRFKGLTPTPGRRLDVIEEYMRVRSLHDFPYWCATFAYIKTKGGGEDTLFILNRPQRKFVAELERQRIAGLPLRIILLKARQWGGSTCSQLYMAWLQLLHREGLNSLIIAQQAMGSDEIKDMFDRLVNSYPLKMLYPQGKCPSKPEKKLIGVGRSGAIFKVPQRNCKIKVGTAERPDSCRGGDYNLVHCSEVGVWKATDGKTPEMIIRSACSGVLLRPMTMIVYESTANGTGNFFQREYEAAKRGESQFTSLFISWFDIDQYAEPLENPEEFAATLLNFRQQDTIGSDRREPGKYLWWLWERGATLEAINWYVRERQKYSSHGMMASEYPSDDVEAFVNSGARVFDKYHVEKLREGCFRALYRGDVETPAGSILTDLSNVEFIEDEQGSLEVWEMPDDDNRYENRYLVVVDIGGRSAKADWSVIAVFDREAMTYGGRPCVVAQWRGHCDIDILAWRAARIAAWYHNALLVIESNTLETRDASRQVDGDQSGYILSQIKNAYPKLYARKEKESDIHEGKPSKYGFHTNVSTKPLIISNLVRCIRENAYIERDRGCLDEYLVYERRQNGSFGAIAGHHDDLLMTRAIGLYICFNEMPLPAESKKQQEGADVNLKITLQSESDTEGKAFF